MKRCKQCNAYINLSFGKDSPATHSGATGEKNDPRSPGDWDDTCDVCCYSKEGNILDARGIPDEYYS